MIQSTIHRNKQHSLSQAATVHSWYNESDFELFSL
jgi:hypothetical protein